MRKFWQVAAALLVLWCWSPVARAMPAPWGTSASVLAGLPDGWQMDWDEHVAQASVGEELNYASASGEAWLYDLGARATSGVTTAEMAQSMGQVSFHDLYEVEAVAGVEQVRIGMRVGLSGQLLGDGPYYYSSVGVQVSFGDPGALVYQASAGYAAGDLSASSSTGELDPGDFEEVDGGYLLSDFQEVVYFWVEPGQFQLEYSLFAATGVTAFLGASWAEADWLDSAAFELFPADPNIISFGSASGQGVVPLPSALLLLGSGLLGLAGLRRRQGLGGAL